MLIIQKNQANKLVMTLTEKTTLAPVYYYLEVFSNQNHNSKAVYLGVDASLFTDRFNEFTITENDIEDLANSIISLDAATYDYFAWECSSASYDDKVSIVESGKLVVNGDATVVSTFTQQPNEYTFNG